MSVEPPRSDADLLRASARGDAAAYGQLYERHAAAARALARQLVRGTEAEDVVAEAFTKILDLVGRGGGPESGFRTYLLTVVRRTVHDRSRVESAGLATGGIEDYDPGVPFVDPALVGLEKSLIARAYLSLPERWRAVLWHVEVERCGPAAVAPLLGLSVNGVAALAYRAREGLRQAYLQLHLGSQPRRECRPVLGRMGAYVRGGLARRDSRMIDEHVGRCEECNGVLLELTDVNRGLRVMVGPLFIGPLFGGYAAALARSTGGTAGLLRAVATLRRTARRHRTALSRTALSRTALGRGPLGRAARQQRPALGSTSLAGPAQDRPVLVGSELVGSGLGSGMDGPVLVGSVLGGPALGKGGRQRRAVLGGGLVVAGAMAAAVLLISADQPAGRPVAVSPAMRTGAPVPAPPPPPSSPLLGPRASERPALVPPPAASAEPAGTPPGQARLRAAVGPLGALVRAQPGIVGIRLRNDGDVPSGDLAVLVDLPAGVTLIPTARHHQAAALHGPVGTADGWACRPAAGGARCERAPLPAGEGTAVFLRVRVAEEAPEGAGPAVRVESGPLLVRARAEEGVRATGAPARFATDGKVTVRAVGNALLTCPEEREGCAEARRRQGDQRDNDLWPMTPLDRDDDPSTRTSSAARLVLPKGGRVVWAGLYWSASGDRAGPIRVRPPGRRSYVTVHPSNAAVRELPNGPVYQAFADVSMLAAGARRTGLWWAADAPVTEGVSGHAGWSLVLVVTDPREPYSQAVVLDTATVVGGPRRRVRLPIGGLTPAAAPARAELVTWEGDAGLAGDRVSLGSGALTPEGGDRDRANVFDGSSGGAAEMTFGVDVDTVGAELGADPGLTVVTDKDVVLFGVAALSVRARS
ncbi:RNA polymerase sigma factor [Nonomuraea coxensis DSM 45129]|uniref:RNA polymerase sigma factor n=1 Tax=Nonomuraea coxensis DSM 45129 TaxID=1122611 RepID=A0ABX8TQY4_9ACTN|nr:sigma-70 family RNA polymerase sigma factor [Nonomuraea coxensis]QYC37896.1 RNA polymerase sigma factor [Nonomuraea coxensis DSM 45129]